MHRRARVLFVVITSCAGLGASLAFAQAAAASPLGAAGRMFAVEHGGDIFLTPLGGGGATNLTRTTDAVDRSPQWSPGGGKRIAYNRTLVGSPAGCAGSQAELWVMNSDGSNQRQLVAGTAVQPQWSPDAQRLLYWGCADGRNAVFSVSASGGPSKRLMYGYGGDYSPNGSRIVYTEPGGHLAIANAHGDFLVSLTGSMSGSQLLAFWSPNGKLIAFSADPPCTRNPCTGGDRNVWVVRPDGSGLRQLTFDSSDGNGNYALGWAPDSSRIYYNKDFTLWAVEPTSGAAEQVPLGTPAYGLYAAAQQPLCTMSGPFPGNVVTGTAGADVICDGAASTQVNGAGGNDAIFAGGGRDIVHGNIGNDVIVGGAGLDKLYGDVGPDLLNALDLTSVDLLAGDLSDLCYFDKGDTVRSCPAG